MEFEANPNFQRLYAHMPGTRQAMQEAVTSVGDHYRRIAPRRTGNMVASAHPAVFRTKNGWEVDFRVPVENEHGTKYAQYVERGTKNEDGSTRIHAQYNLRNAVIAAGQENP